MPENEEESLKLEKLKAEQDLAVENARSLQRREEETWTRDKLKAERDKAVEEARRLNSRLWRWPQVFAILLPVLASIAAIGVPWALGIFDVKRDRLVIEKERLTMEIERLEERKHPLQQQLSLVSNELFAARADLESATNQLSGLDAKLESLHAELVDARRNDAYRVQALNEALGTVVGRDRVVLELVATNSFLEAQIREMGRLIAFYQELGPWQEKGTAVFLRLTRETEEKYRTENEREFYQSIPRSSSMKWPGVAMSVHMLQFDASAKNIDWLGKTLVSLAAYKTNYAEAVRFTEQLKIPPRFVGFH